MPEKVLIFTATYNERDTIEPLLEQISLAVPEADILVVDDNSPDGTGRLLDSLAKANARLCVHHRASKLGLGSAHKVAFHLAQKAHYAALVTMDADFSHDPKVIPRLLEGLNQYEYVIGSRFAEGGRLDYTGFRRLVSFGANFIARWALGIRCREITTSFRAFRGSLLERMDIEQVQAEGYSFFLECSYLVSHLTTLVAEVPIHFQDRRCGQSKISKAEIFNGFVTLFRLFLRRLRAARRPGCFMSCGL